MATIKENGAPTKHTVGAVGDFYDDLDTGKRYECESILTVSGGFQEYEWCEVEQVTDEDDVLEEVVPEPEQPEESPVTEEEVIEEKKSEQPVNNQQYGQNRNNNRNWNGNKTQYNKQYRPNNK